MQGELKCSQCSQLYIKPLLLPCSHSLCSACCEKLLEPVDKYLPPTLQDEGTDCDFADMSDMDKLSIISETDSGVVCNSRPSSFVDTASINDIFQQTIQKNTYGIKCPVCQKLIILNDKGIKGLPYNRVLENIIEKYSRSNKNSSVSINCQLCENESTEATVMCEQCEIFYCDACRDSCHPSRGPLAKHNLVDPTQGSVIIRAKGRARESTCLDHPEELLCMYCLTCKSPMCLTCQQDQHINHEAQALGPMTKSHKTELSKILQAMSEKAKAGTEFIQRLKGMSERVNVNCTEFEEAVVAQCDALIEAISKRREELLNFIHKEREMKIKVMKEQVSHCTAHLQRTTSLLHFSIEVLKESDHVSFLQVSNGLINRVATVDQTFNKEMELAPRVSPEFELTLDNTPVIHAIDTMNFFQMKAPGRPSIVPEECSAENNSVTIAWNPYMGSLVEAYTLELDDGNGGDFRVVYVGRDTICTVDGLHFNSIYNARVKAHNHAGESDYSDLVSLQTAGVAWFTLDPPSAHPDIIFSNNNLTATCNSFDHRVVLGGVGFSKGVHYWECLIDRYDNHTDPAIGIARFDVDKAQILGKDDKGWSMYIDDKRSWFLHHDDHSNRTDGGIHTSSVIGVLLDLNQHTLSYFVDDEPHGPIAFTDLHGVFFPAISINRNVQVTLRTGLEVPFDSDEEHD